MSETLEQKLRANKARSIAHADATANKERWQKIQQQKKQQEELEQYQKDLAKYQRQKAEYERQVQKLEAEKQAEEQRIAAEKAEAEKIKADRQAITDRYDSQIQDIQRQKEQSLVFKPWTGKQPYLHNSTPVIKPDGTRTTHRGWVPRGYKIGELVPQTQSRIRHLNGRINSLKHQQRGELNRYDAQAYPSWAKSGWSSSSFPDTSLAEYAQRKIDAKNAEAERARQSSIKNAQSNAIKAMENHEKTAREFESRRDSLGIKLSKGQIRLAQLKEPQKATRTRPKVHPGSHFKGMEKTPVSIFGTTPLQSKKAEATFENTQFQQKELFAKVTGAASWNEAISHRKDAMKNNAYVGTANTIFEKGKEVGSSGVLIEKKARVQDVFEELAEPIYQKQEIQTDVIVPQNPKPEMETKVVFSQNSQIPTYEFPKQIIPSHSTPKHYDQWRYMSSLLDMEPKTPSKTDKLLNQYMQNNQKQIDNTKETGEANPIKIPVLDAVRDYGVEFGLNLAAMYAGARGKIYNEPELTTQQKMQKIYDTVPHEKSLEAVLFDSAMESSKNSPATISGIGGTINVIPEKQPQSIPTSSSYIREKTKSWEGTEYLAGTIGVSVLGAFVPFGRAKSAIGQAAKPTIQTTPSSPNNLAYLLKQSHQEPKLITKKVTVAEGGTIDVIDFDAMKKAKTTPHTPTINDKIKRKSKKLKKGVSDKLDQTIGKQKRKLEFEDAMYQYELEKAYSAKTKDSKPKKKPSRSNPISKASRKIKFENTMLNHNLEKMTAKKTETPMLDKLLGKSSRYVKTSAKINNKKVKDKSSQIKDVFSDTIKDNILDPVSKRTTRPVGKFVRKAKASKKINQHNLEKLLQDSTQKYDVTNTMKKPEINHNVFGDIVKNNKKKKKPLTKAQKAESGWEYSKANNPTISKPTTSSKTTTKTLFTN